MALTARLTSHGPPTTDPEDFFASALGVIFPDDVTNQHGDPDHGLLYTSPHLPKPLHIRVADPKGAEDRRLFSHFLWNSSLLLAELVEAGTLKLDAAALTSTQAGSSSLGGSSGSSISNGNGTVKIAAPASDFDVTGCATIELGAGTALPSLLSAVLGARRVVITDYPSSEVMDTLRRNVSSNTEPSFVPPGRQLANDVQVEGHRWGELDTPVAKANKHAFDRVFVADCLWMPWQHENLRRSVGWFLSEGEGSRAWVVAGFHTGRQKMQGFFDADALKAEGLEVERIWERDCDGNDREWAVDRGFEDPGVRKRWLVVAVLRRVIANRER
ncbi:hypothetical protein B0H63DRAFT_308706 [Podospora didyma]|uniref:Nicotinamide N-methyltransferase n=1 Tax=Podospora didyma TaxID=330526 RepID=A0AAE0K5R7_9PEZI|nr:hypothetical protein B0H63DRAFT_308706 [Podospora didyma]